MSSSYGNLKKLLGDKPRLLLLNKTDLVNSKDLDIWKKYLIEKESCKIFCFNTKNNIDISGIIKEVLRLSEPKIQALMQKGLLRRPARTVVIGMPNVGKSSVINALTKTSKTKVGAKAGVTRQQQWVRINPQLDLLDTPGIIPTRQDNQEQAVKLAFVNSVSENAYSPELVATELLNLLKEDKFFKSVGEYYKIDNPEQLTIDDIALNRNWLIKSSQPDTQRTAAYILKDFREGRLGKFILDELPE